MKIYQVGGSVRDRFIESIHKIKTTSHDIDYVVVGSTPEEMISKGFIQVGKSFPVFLHPETKDEYSLARKEIKAGPKHTDFEFDFNSEVTLEEDLARRDFTINAIAEEIINGTAYYCDPFNGIKDIINKRIVHVNAEHFVEDSLRVLRGCRFAAQLDFDIDPETMNLFKQMVQSGEMNNLSRDRIDNEFVKAMWPGFNSVKFIEYMRECGALKLFYPELYALFENAENIKYHNSGNTGLHTLKALDVVRDQPAHIKIAVLYHDIYKPIAYKKTYYNTDEELEELKKQGGPYHARHDDWDAIEYLNERLSHTKFNNRIKNACNLAVKYHMNVWKLFDGMTVKKWVDFVGEITDNYNLDKEYLIDDLLLVCKADDWSDKTEACLQRGHDFNRIHILEDVIHKTFDICSEIYIRDINEYQNKDWRVLKEEQRRIRINKVRTNIKFFNK